MKKLIRTFCLLLTICLTLTLLPVPAQAGGDMAMPGVYPTISAYGANLVIKNDGSLWSLGYDFGATDYVWNRDDHGIKIIKIMDSVATVSCGFESGMAVKTDGSLWGFGKVAYSEIGFHGEDLGNVVLIDPTPFKIMDDVVSVSSGDYYTLAIKKDGSLWGWGNNDGGQIGIGTTQYVPYPVKIMDNVVQASASGYGNSMALKNDGTLWRWGYGAGESPDQLTPRKIMDGIAAFSDSGYFRVIKSDASLWFCIMSATPLNDIAGAKYENGVYSYKVMDGVAAVASMGDYTMPIKKDGSLWVLEGYFFGFTGGVSPVKLMDSVAQVSCGLTTMVVKTDGSLWAWGANDNDWMGIGEGVSLETPTKFMDGVKMPVTTSSTPQPTQPTPTTVTATPTASTVLVNGKSVAFDAYNINGNNYFKLRDLAYALNGSEKQFEVVWDGTNNAISLTSGNAYTAVGGEMTGKGSGNKTGTPTTSKILLNGKEVTFTAYNIDGNNYFKLRDIGLTFDFSVTWDGARNTIVIDTSKGYTPD